MLTSVVWCWGLFRSGARRQLRTRGPCSPTAHPVAPPSQPSARLSTAQPPTLPSSTPLPLQLHLPSLNAALAPAAGVAVGVGGSHPRPADGAADDGIREAGLVREGLGEETLLREVEVDGGVAGTPL